MFADGTELVAAEYRCSRALPPWSLQERTRSDPAEPAPRCSNHSSHPRCAISLHGLCQWSGGAVEQSLGGMDAAMEPTGMYSRRLCTTLPDGRKHWNLASTQQSKTPNHNAKTLKQKTGPYSRRRPVFFCIQCHAVTKTATHQA